MRLETRIAANFRVSILDPGAIVSLLKRGLNDTQLGTVRKVDHQDDPFAAKIQRFFLYHRLRQNTRLSISVKMAFLTLHSAEISSSKKMGDESRAVRVFDDPMIDFRNIALNHF